MAIPQKWIIISIISWGTIANINVINVISAAPRGSRAVGGHLDARVMLAGNIAIINLNPA